MNKSKKTRKIIKNLLSVIFIVIFNFVSFGQDRQNREKYTFQDQSLILNNATGWSFNEPSGEWVDYDNVICKDKSYKDKFKDLQGEYMASHYRQNFISIQTKRLVVKEETFYVLIIKQWSGSYKYPSLREDWETYQRVDVWGFTETEWSKCKNINGLVKIKSSLSTALGKYDEYDEDIIISKLIKDLDVTHGDIQCIFPLLGINGKIRFCLPVCGSSDTSSSIYEYTKPKYNFDKEYFEVDLDNFNKLLKF